MIKAASLEISSEMNRKATINFSTSLSAGDLGDRSNTNYILNIFHAQVSISELSMFTNISG